MSRLDQDARAGEINWLGADTINQRLIDASCRRAAGGMEKSPPPPQEVIDGGSWTGAGGRKTGGVVVCLCHGAVNQVDAPWHTLRTVWPRLMTRPNDSEPRAIYSTWGPSSTICITRVLTSLNGRAKFFNRELGGAELPGQSEGFFRVNFTRPVITWASAAFTRWVRVDLSRLVSD